GSTNAWGAGPDEDYDGDRDSAYLEYLNNTNPKLASSRWRLSRLAIGSTFYVLFNRIANRGYELEFTADLGNPDAWKPLDSPGNSPSFSSGDYPAFVPDAIHSDEQSRLYRIRVYER
ncbi:MAG: hypothetical protein MUC91_05835, partial [Verrucomicrobia bacterium]|nr:hypothetical protein [Verrucomicrobiota bacterium]